MNLFNTGNFTLHSGEKTDFKIDCDALTDDDIETLAFQISKMCIFTEVYGIPTGGERLASALKPYCTNKGFPLVVDDVYTTGKSMWDFVKEVGLAGTIWHGIVIFARGKPPCHIFPIFQMK